MNTRMVCPRCGTRNTHRVHVEWSIDSAEEVRFCENCPAEYTNEMGLFDQTVDEVINVKDDE